VPLVPKYSAHLGLLLESPPSFYARKYTDVGLQQYLFEKIWSAESKKSKNRKAAMYRRFIHTLVRLGGAQVENLAGGGV